ncbi:MAG TPA: hypothetical protein VK797_02835 [Tepidisphaeraceae bacterium]|jgi:hypothetical protein|nr:hypothetical protein [Tepidisphaeraceae bacterium]
MRRRLLAVVSAVSLLVWVVAAVFLAMSYKAPHQIIYHSRGLGFCVIVCRGQILLGYQRPGWGYLPMPEGISNDVYPSRVCRPIYGENLDVLCPIEPLFKNMSLERCRVTDRRFLGIALQRYGWREDWNNGISVPLPPSATYLGLPIVWPLVALALLPILSILRRAKRRQRLMERRRDIRCIACGYSLTGNTSGVCPECGTPVPKEPIKKRPRTA